MPTEYRARFSYPPSILGETADTFGPARRTITEAETDRCFRPEESHGWRSGVEFRHVTEWEPLG